MSPDDLIRVRHMVEAAELAIGFASGRERADLDRDAMLRLAVLHAVQIVGEAAAKVSAAARAEASGIDWPAIVGMRHRLVHGYMDINADVVWQTLQTALPALVEQLRAIEGVGAPDAGT